MTFLEIVKGILTDREYGQGYFSGAKGTIRFVLLLDVLGIIVGVYLFLM